MKLLNIKLNQIISLLAKILSKLYLSTIIRNKINKITRFQLHVAKIVFPPLATCRS